MFGNLLSDEVLDVIERYREHLIPLPETLTYEKAVSIHVAASVFGTPQSEQNSPVAKIALAASAQVALLVRLKRAEVIS